MGHHLKKNITEKTIFKNVKTIDWKLLNDKYIEEFDIIAKSGFSPKNLKKKPDYYGGSRLRHKTSKKKMYNKMMYNKTNHKRKK